MRTALTITALIATVGMSAAIADANLAKAKLCTACHEADKEGIGPSYKAIAKQYQGVPGAAKTIASKIKTGGSGHWGPKVMPPPEARDATVNDVEAMDLALWVLKR